MRFFALTFFVCCLFGCSKKEDPSINLYFPPVGSGTWESVAPASVGWDETKMGDLRTYLSATNTRALIVLKDGKIVIEEYLGTQLTGGAFTASSNWYWASAGKTLTSALVGIAESQGKINFDAKTSDYLGTGWTSLTPTQESQITVRHQLTMTTGLDDYSNVGSTGNKDCTTPSCLIYKAAPGTRWAYHNAPYTLLDGVIAASTGQSLNTFVSTQLLTKIGMDGAYTKVDFNNVFFSTPRSMARYGLLLLNKGNWNGTNIIPESYYNLMVTTSQNINQSYGYLTWLNGKSSFMAPSSQTVFQSSVSPDAPADMFAAMGKNGQIVNIVPSQNLVVVRMGDAPDGNLVPFTFQNDLWVKLKLIIK
jgi:CubicO group peptidase (beta-lactamase class C family)